MPLWLIYTSQKCSLKCFQNLLKAHEKITNIGLRYSLAEVKKSISNIYLFQNNIKKAFKYIDECVAIGFRANQKDNLLKLYTSSLINGVFS